MLTRIGLEAFVAVQGRSGSHRQLLLRLEQAQVDLLERYAVLGNAVESRLPYKCHVTGIGGLKSP
jgi:hypothetical protein